MVTLDIVYDDLVYETDKAYLLRFDDRDVWVPKSQVQDIDDEYVTLPLWLIEEKELETYIVE